MKSWRSFLGVAAIAVGVTAGLWAAEIDRRVSWSDRLGGMPAIRAVVDDLVLRILSDARVSPWFAHAAADPSLLGPLCPHHDGVAAEVAHAVRAEWALTLGDVLLRRTAQGLGACQALDCVDEVARRMGDLLGWDGERRKAEVAAYRREIEPMRRFSME